MHGMSAADIENIVNESAVKVVRDKRKKMTIADIEYAIEKVTTSKTGKSKSRDKRIGFMDVI